MKPAPPLPSIAVKLFTWSPTIIYTLVAIVLSDNHGRAMQPVVNQLAVVEAKFTATYEGLKRGEALSPPVQVEMARLGAHHTHHAKEYVEWTQGWVWLVLMPGIAVMGLQGWACGRSKTMTTRSRSK